MNAELPTWAILSPVPPDVLTDLIGRDEVREQWMVKPGSGTYNALVDFEPGTEHSGEREVALELSRNFPGKHYVLYFDPDMPFVSVFEGGTLLEEDEGAPEALAQDLDCPIGETIGEPIEESPIYGALVATDATPEEVAAALKVPMPLPGSPLSIYKVDVGTMAYSTAGSLFPQGEFVSLKVAGLVIAIAHDADPEYGFFRCSLFERGTEQGRFELPPSPWSEDMRVESVLGESTPEGILRKVSAPWL